MADVTITVGGSDDGLVLAVMRELELLLSSIEEPLVTVLRRAQSPRFLPDFPIDLGDFREVTVELRDETQDWDSREEVLTFDADSITIR